MRDRTDYDALLATSRQRSIFAESWWLDAATGSADGWVPNVVRDSAGVAIAAWPLVRRAAKHGDVGTGAPYTPFLGPLLPDRAAGADGTSADVALLDQLGNALADWAHVEAACAPELDYWTPLAWHGFEQTTRTTWRIAATTDIDSVRAGLRSERRRNLSAATKAGFIVEAGTVDDLLTACAATFERQSYDGVPGAVVLRRLAAAALERDRGSVLVVRTGSGELASAGLFVHDDRWTWNLANGHLHVDGGQRGAPTLLQWTAIEHALARGTGFDFEGSMLRPIERFVRGFGGTPHAYSVVRRSSPAWARTVARRRFLKRLLRR